MGWTTARTGRCRLCVLNRRSSSRRHWGTGILGAKQPQCWNQEHPGCMVSGYVLVNGVPGNFHIEAKVYTTTSTPR